MRKTYACLSAMLLTGTAAPSSVCHLARATAQGATIAYRDCGRGDPVVIVPGGPGLDAEYMAPLARMIVRLGHRAILVEPRGTGASRDALGAAAGLSVTGSINDIEAVREAIAAPRVTLIGHSFGGAVAQAYADRHADRIASLVLLDSVGPNMRPPVTPLDSWRRRLTPAELTRYDEARARGDRRSAMRIKFQASFFHAARGRAFLSQLPDTAIHLDVAPLASDYERNYTVEATASPRFPVTVVNGEIDWIRGNEAALRAAYPAERLIVVPRAGHFPWADAPAATRRALRLALRENGRDG
jgi:proline iminopeptidase